MHYTHHFPIIRKRKHAIHLSLIILGVTLVTIFAFGFTRVNARDFLTGFVLSFIRVTIAYVISLVAAIILALITTKNKTVEDILLPILDVLQSFPSVAMLPLLITIFGKTDTVVIAILFITMIWPILFTILTGIKSEGPELLEASHIFGASGYKKLRYVT